MLLEEWVSIFRENSFKTILLRVPKEFLEYLQDDGIITSGNIPKSEISSSEDEEDENENDASINDPTKSFCEFHKLIQQSIRELGGSCIAKLGPNSPKDAIWITTEHTLCCQSAEDVYELLKASDRVALSLKNGTCKYLVLKRWMKNMESSMEFRCFVRNNKLVAICQRDDTVYYPHLQSAISTLKVQIQDFFTKVIKNNTICWTAYVFDLNLNTLEVKKSIIVDFSPWDSNETSGILFSWEELESLQEGDELMMKVIEKDEDCRLGVARYNFLPSDMESIQNILRK